MKPPPDISTFAPPAELSVPSRLADLMELTKTRMNVLVVATTAVGYVAGVHIGGDCHNKTNFAPIFSSASLKTFSDSYRPCGIWENQNCPSILPLDHAHCHPGRSI